MRKILKGSIAFILASTFTVSSTVFAADAETETYETVDLQEVQSQLGTVQAETPSLVPGDFFYFAKKALENIKLALTFDRSEEAKLLAEYASERLAEASVLYGEGKEEEALEVIQTALGYIENSQSIIDEETIAKEGSDEQNAAVGEAANTEEETGVQDDSLAEQDTISNDLTDEDEALDEQTDESVSDEESSEEQNQYSEAQDTLRHNIAALSAAMEHVGSDNAKAALQRNIDKTRAKIQKKLAKLEKKYGEAVVLDNQEEDDTASLDGTEGTEVNSDSTEAAAISDAETVSAPEEPVAATEGLEQDDVIAPAALPQNQKGNDKAKQAEKKAKNENNGKGQQKQMDNKGKENTKEK